jgi:glycosyltransferase involved in cell wall biosynthesis
LSPFQAVARLSPKERRAHRQALGLKEQDIVLGNVSRLVPWKGHDYAVEVFGALKETFPNLKLMIVGDAKTPSEKGYKEHLIKQVRRRGLEGDIIFTGWVQDPARYFAALDLYLLTSMPFEGVPGAVIEAAVTGVPVVGFEVYGVREIPGVQATLVPPKDVRALTSALREKLQDLAIGNGNGNGNQSAAVQNQMRQQFDLGRMVRETWDVYHHILRN